MDHWGQSIILKAYRKLGGLEMCYIVQSTISMYCIRSLLMLGSPGDMPPQENFEKNALRLDH